MTFEPDQRKTAADHRQDGYDACERQHVGNQQAEIDGLTRELESAKIEITDLEDCRESLRRIGERVCGCEHVDNVDERAQQVHHIMQAFDKARAIVSQLPCINRLVTSGPEPKLVRDVPAVPDKPIFYHGVGGIIETEAIAIVANCVFAKGHGSFLGNLIDSKDCYDTREAAVFAKKEADDAD